MTGEPGGEESAWILWRSGLAPCDDRLDQWGMTCVCVP